MTPREEFELLRKISRQADELVLEAFEELQRLIRTGIDPRDATATVMASFTGEYAAAYQAGLASVMAASVGGPSPVPVATQKISLSQRLYTQTQVTASRVTTVVDNHRKGFQDSRKLATELYEGYDFRPEGEVLNIKRRNKRLPKYMREAILIDPGLEQDIARAFAKLQVDDLRTPALRAAYTEVLSTLDKLETTKGQKLLEKKLKIAFYEKTRYFAKRIAETELHRNYSIERAKEYLGDTDVEYVQWRLSPAHPVEDICDYFAGVDAYGLGPGVYPKARAPVAPAHPFCKCYLIPRLDLTGQAVNPVEEADAKFFRKWSADNQRKIAGSMAKLERIQKGDNAWDVHNSTIDPEYQVKPAGSL